MYTFRWKKFCYLLLVTKRHFVPLYIFKEKNNVSNNDYIKKYLVNIW